MNTKDFAYFQALAHLHSFTKVAETFQVSQPSISYAIKRLEKQFNCKLIHNDPSHRTFQLTPQGELLLRRVDAILPEIQAAKNEITRSFTEQTTIGFPPMIMDHLFRTSDYLPQHSSLLQSIHPIQDGSIELLQLVKSGAIAGSFIGSLSPLDDPALSIQPLFQTELQVILSKDHPYASKTELSFEEIASEDFIILDEHFVHLRAFEQLCHRHHQAPLPLFQTEDVTLIKQLIRKGVGLSLLAPITLTEGEEDLLALPLKSKDRIPFYVSFVSLQTTHLPDSLKTWIKDLETTNEGKQ